MKEYRFHSGATIPTKLETMDAAVQGGPVGGGELCSFILIFVYFLPPSKREKNPLLELVRSSL